MNYSFDPTKKNGKMKINITMCSSKSVSDVLASKEFLMHSYKEKELCVVCQLKQTRKTK